VERPISLSLLSTNGTQARLWAANLLCHKPANLAPPPATATSSFAANKLTGEGVTGAMWNLGMLFCHVEEQSFF